MNSLMVLNALRVIRAEVCLPPFVSNALVSVSLLFTYVFVYGRFALQRQNWVVVGKKNMAEEAQIRMQCWPFSEKVCHGELYEPGE